MAKDLAKEEDSSQLAEQIARLIENAKRHIAAQVKQFPRQCLGNL